MRLSINPLIKGKLPKDQVPQIESLNAWVEVNVSPEDAFALITEDGYATTCALTCGNRKEHNFASRQLFMIDVDGGMTIEELLNDEFYNECGFGFYATPSFTPELHKFRILFLVEIPFVSATASRQFIRALRKIYPQSDPACVDPARLFYGNVNCQIKEFKGTCMDHALVKDLVDIIQQEDQAMAYEMARQPKIEYAMTDQRRQHILELLHSQFVGNYPIWRNIGWGLKAGGFSLQDFQYVTTGMMQQKTANVAAKIWHAGSTDGRVTMGSVIYFLKERLGPDCLKKEIPTTGADAARIFMLERNKYKF